MKREEKARAMDKASEKVNKAKDLIADASEILESYGMGKDAEAFMRIIYKLETIQNKY